MVVTAPHILPCPVPHHSVRADGVEEDRQRCYKDEEKGAKEGQKKGRRKQEQGRRCPIPRPRKGGLVEEVLRLKELFGDTGDVGNPESLGGKVVFERRPGKGT